MKIGIKCRLYPTAEQAQVIHQTLGNSRFIYNYFLAKHNTYWKENKDLPKDKRAKTLSNFDNIKLLPILKKEIFSIDLDLANKLFEANKNLDWMTINSTQFETLKTYWLKDSLSTALQKSLIDLDNSFQKFYKKTSGYPQFKKKTNHNSFSITPNNWMVKKIENNEFDNELPIKSYEFYLNKTNQPLNIKFDRDFNPAKVSKITISKTPRGKFFITFLVDEEIKDLKQKNYKKLTARTNQVSSIDLGIRSTMTILNKDLDAELNKTSLKDKDYYVIEKKLAGLKRHAKILARAQRILSRKQKNSKNRNKQRIKVTKVHENLVNYRTNFYHQVSHDLVRDNDKIIIENLDIKSMMKNKRMAKQIAHQSWGQFINMLKYKSEWYGKELVIADRFFPSSKFCSACGEYNKNYGLEPNQKSINIPEYWTCGFCQAKHQRDENACKNLINYEVLKNTYKVKKNIKGHSVKLNKKQIQLSSKINKTLKKDNISKEIIPLSEWNLNACVR